ncbi:sensor histidine kinase [Bacillus niameyensis]|uniref:sensor histidine kinase n=1 Tax=Bacillus niameyensis TaxID=1522308 RepID=UPI000783386F|nr:sensor histidine kinase [Bacillus niameyensis]
MKLFEPVVAFINRFTYIQKFNLIGTIVGIPIIIMSLMLVHTINKEITIIEVRKKGANYNASLKELLRDVQIHRGLSIRYLSGDTSVKAALAEKQLSISKELKTINEYDEALNINQTMELIQDQWEEVNSRIGRIQVHETTSTHNELIVLITDLMVTNAENSGLYQSKSNGTYYMIEHVTKTLPQFTDDLGRIRGEAMNVLVKKEISQEQRDQYITLSASVEQSLKEIEYGINIILAEKPLLRNSFKDVSQAVLIDTGNFLLSAKQNLHQTPEFTSDPEEFFQAATSMIDAGFHLYDIETNELEKIMIEQMNELKKKRLLMIILSVLFASLTLYFFIVFYLSMHRTTEEAKMAGYFFTYKYLFFPQLKQIADSKERVELKYEETEQRLYEVEKKMSQQVFQAHEDERKRVSRELHDGIGQTIYSIIVLLNLIELENLDDWRTDKIKKAKAIAANAMKEVKQIARSLRPSSLDDLGFVPALKSFIEEFEKTHGISVIHDLPSDQNRFNPDIETVLYRICQESLTNVAKYSQANSVYVCLHDYEQEILLTVYDDGQGFYVDKSVQDSQRKGIGLFSMKERAEGLEGSFQISSKLNQGTTIKVRIPKNQSK